MSIKRCYICNIKLKLDGWNCKCNSEFLFCTNHRLPFDHNCTYNFKINYTKDLEKNLLKIDKQKIEKI